MYNTIWRTQTEDTCTYNRQTDGQTETDEQRQTDRQMGGHMDRELTGMANN